MELSDRKQSSTGSLQWEELVESTFDRPERKVSVAHEMPPASEAKPSPGRKKWLWAVVAAVAVVAIAAACILPPLFKAEENASIPDELLPCKEALDQWQSLDSYQITRSIQHYGEGTALAVSTHQEYWKSGSDWIQIHYFNNTGVGNVGYMYRDGILYEGHGWDRYTWTTMEHETDVQTGLWPIIFSWDSCELIHKITTETELGKHIIFAVIERDPESRYYETSPYHVCFTFNVAGLLDSISVSLTGSDSISGMAVSVSTYRLVSEDADAIAQYISKQAVNVEITDIELD